MDIRIPQTDPLAGYLAQKDALDQAMLRVLASGYYILGQECSNFEKEFAAYLGSNMKTVGVGSGTEALHLALRTLGIGPGDAVITVSHTAVATVAAIELAGAIPVLVDIDPQRMTMDPASLEQAIAIAKSGGFAGLAGAKIKAVIPVHIYGQPADMETIVSLARTHGLYVIEDCAQAHGADIDGRKVGTWGDLAAFSFYPTKNLGAFGDGGALVGSDGDLIARAAVLRQYGWKERYISHEPGLNSRLDELQAALLRVRLGALDPENNRRREVAALYDQALADSGITVPPSIAGTQHVYHQYVLRSDKRYSLQTFLADHNVSTAIHYPKPVHLQPAYQNRIPHVDLPITEKLFPEILSLPMHPGLTDEQANTVSTTIRQWCDSLHRP
ncbi:MAG: DegT/DnrJ/EryC1/StrS family aminotransferase [Proteobacteria bacterium]|nr:DegT/DnrJ/EryC1/StrS family aminotransferase [Pseudomonadota bacterium]